MPTYDLSAVPEPAGLLVSGRVTQLSKSLATAHAWTKLPMPQSEQVTELLTSEAVGPLVDLDRSIDFAVAVSGSGMKMKPMVAVSAAVHDPDKAKAMLAERYKLVPGDNGAQLIEGLGKPTAASDDDDHDEGPDHHGSARSCELAPAYGEASLRIVCAENAAALQSLAPWLLRTATRAKGTSDVHVDFTMKPLQPTLQEQKRMIGMLLGTVLGGKIGMAGLRDLAVAFGTDLVDFASDMEGASIDLTLGDGGAVGDFALRLSGNTSTLGRIAVGHPERSGPAPAAFWQLPADADFAMYGRGFEEADLARGRDLALHALGDLLGAEGVKDPDRKAATDALGKLVSPAASVYGSGVDADAVRKALAAERGLTPKTDLAEREEGKRRTIEALLGWRVAEIDAPAASFQAGLKELAGVLARPSVAAAYREKLKDSVPPSFKSAPLGKVTLPAGAQHYVLELHSIDRKAAPPPRAEPGKPSPPARRPAGPVKPLLVHVFLVPDGGRTWLGVGGDEGVVAAKLATAMGQAGDKLGSRGELGDLKNGSSGGGGFLTLRGLPEAIEQGKLVLEGMDWRAIETFEEASQLPHQGMTPIVFTSTPQAGGPPKVATSHVVVPRDAIEDFVALVLKRGGF
jgi:hypothetical protein